VNVKSSVGSIGSAGEPFVDSVSRRIKGFYPDIVRDIQDANQYLGVARSLRDSSGTSRITLRFITPVGFEIPNSEAVIPLDDRWTGYQIIYYGENLLERMTTPDILEQEDEIVSWVLNNRRSDSPLERVRGLNYTITILSDPTSNDIKQFSRVYSEAFEENGNVKYMFDINETNVRELVTNNTSVVTVARNYDGQIVSTIIGETSVINTSHGNLTICEYSDEATLRTYRKLGLSQACLQLLGEELYSDSVVDLLYAEARALHIGANKVPANLGYRYDGRLIQHCFIGGDKEVEGYHWREEDLNVWHLPKVT
jgi:hypothetical protein